MRAHLMVAVVSVVAGCGASAPPSSTAARSAGSARPAGCDVQVFSDAPPMATDNIGPVNAICGEDVSRDDCVRTMKDAACRLGGDVVWGVARTPSLTLGKQRFDGRAAHTRGPK